MQAAARLNDPIAHTSALEGLIAGAVIGAGLAAGAAVIIGTGGLAAPVLIGAGLATVATGAWLGEFAGSLSFFDEKSGELATGSPDVFINFKPAGRALADLGRCKDESKSPEIAIGSGSVFINGFPAARVDDKLVCGGVIVEGSPDVFIGGGQVELKPVKEDVPWEVHGLVTGAGVAAALLLGGWAVVPGLVGGVALGLAGGELLGLMGSYYADWLSRKIGGKPSDWEKAGVFAGQALGGWLGAKAVSKVWESIPRIEVVPDAVGINGGNIRIPPRQRPLITKEMIDLYRNEHIPGYANNWLKGNGAVEYLDEAGRAERLLTIRDGKFYDAKGKLYDTANSDSFFRGDGTAIYVMDENGNFYAESQVVERFHHSSFLAGKPVAGAGELEVTKGELKYINCQSGHYRPTSEMLQQTINELRVKGLRMDDCLIGGF